MQNTKLPNTALMLFHNHAPWEMIKALDTGCLCKDCEIFHLLRRGITGACVALDKIVERAGTAEMSVEITQLIKIKDILSTTSKYDTIVKCLKPCLETDKLEDVKHSCLHGEECESYDFCQWWPNGLRKSIFNVDATINLESILAGDEWSLSGINCRCFTYVAKPTIAEHDGAQ